ncbi:MAG TPA: hypothetical protein VE093_46345 [Polyangiaceae bacterium]|nr:hypothetical protein [Polyangiaceae bacterium]
MQSPHQRLLCALPAAVAIVLFLGCGGGEPAMKTPAGGSAEPATVPEALADLDRAEAELASAIGSPTFAAPPGDTAGQSTRDASPTTSAPPPPASPQAGGAEQTDSTMPQPDPCVTACRALASMSRSAEHVCGLAGEGDGRCESARSRVQRATDRVRAQCPGCQ